MKHSKFPIDQYDTKFLQEVFPSSWKNPSPAPSYDLVIVGAGPAGMVSALLASAYHKKIALVEKEHFGGECLNAGCIPSKALIRSSRLAAEIGNAKELGIDVPKGWKVNFPAVMKRVRRLRSAISSHDSVALFKKMGIDIFLGDGHFTGPNTLQVKGQILRFKKAILATGTQPMIPEIPGLKEAGYLTNQTIFTLTTLPKRLVILGAGAIGCELSQAFTRFGSKVTVIARGSQILSREDSTASGRLQKELEKEGVEFLFNSQIQKIKKKGAKKVICLKGSKEEIVVDEILVALGRTPTVQGFGLEKAGVVADLKTGIVVNDSLQTSNPHIYSVGDMHYQLTHVSKEHARIAVENTLGNGQAKKSSLVISWCTFSDPEIAHVGLTEKDAQKQGVPIRTLQLELGDIERPVLDGETLGFVKLHVREGTDQIVGATIMARHAGEMIAEVGVAITAQVGLLALTRTIHPFPTQAQAIRVAAEALVKTMAIKDRRVA